LNSSIAALTSSSVPSKVCVVVFVSPSTVMSIVTFAVTPPSADFDFSIEISLFS